MERKVAQSIASVMQTMPSQGSSTTVFIASPAPNSIPNGTTAASTSVKPMEVQCNAGAPNHNTPTSKAMKPHAQQVNNKNSPKLSPAKSQPKSIPKKQVQTKPEQALDTKVEVSGYPVYVKPQDLYKVFSSYGAARVEHVGRRYAVVAFDSREAARAAIGDSLQLCLYSQFLAVRPFSGVIDDQKRLVYKSKHTVVTVAAESIPLEGSFAEQLGALLAAVRLTQHQVSALAALYGDLERVMQPVWPGCQAMPFGSITTGLGVKSSDADCFMNIPPQFRYGFYNFVTKAKRILQQYPELFAEVFAIPRANTPIVKLFHLPTRTHCDLTFKTPLGALNSKLLAFLLHADPRLLPLAVAVKYWASVHGLSGSGRLTNYALTLLLVFYLQCRGALPPVARLQRDAPPLVVDGWNAGFREDPALLPRAADDASVRELLGGFFRFYAAFDFDTQVACPYLGRPVPKEKFVEADLPDEFGRYVRNVADDLVAPLRVKVPVCVQDPFEQCHNVASAVTVRMADDFRAYVRFAADHYEKDLANECRGFLRAILLERPEPVHARANPEYRVALPPRLLDAIVRDDWQEALRSVVFTIFERMLQLKLAPIGEKETTRNGREKERYATTMRKPLWKRKQFARMYDALRMGFVERHARVTEEILATERGECLVEFQVVLSFCTKVRSAWVSVRFTGGEMDAFYGFAKYFIATMQNWVASVLRASGATTGNNNPPTSGAGAGAAADPATDSDSDDVPDEGSEKTEIPKKVPEEPPTAVEKTADDASEEVMVEAPSPPGAEASPPAIPECSGPIDRSTGTHPPTDPPLDACAREAGPDGK